MKKNPPGYPLSGQTWETDDGEFVVTHRPRFKGRKKRPRVQVPEEVAQLLGGAQERETERRQALAEDDRPRKRKKRAKKSTAKKSTAKKSAKKRTRRAPPRPPPRSLARRTQAAAETTSDVAATLAARPGQQELFANPRGAPSLARLGTCADLGRVVEVCVELPSGEHEVTAWKRNYPRLLWSPATRSLVFAAGRKPTGRRKGATRADGAARLFGQWAQRPATTTSTITIPRVKLTSQGRAVYIVYKSDKWGPKGGRTVQYVHDFGASVKVYHGKSVWAVRGGRLTVTERGIVF